MTASHVTTPLKAAQVKKFEGWLTERGAEILAPTNPWEVMRFRAGSATGVIYNSRGRWTCVHVAIEALQAFRSNAAWKAPIPVVKRAMGTRHYPALMKRDGPACFYCGKDVSAEDSSLEHIVPVSHGGPNHMSNYALAHKSCNQEAGNLSAVEKVRLRDRMRAANHNEGATP